MRYINDKLPHYVTSTAGVLNASSVQLYSLAFRTKNSLFNLQFILFSEQESICTCFEIFCELTCKSKLMALRKYEPQFLSKQEYIFMQFVSVKLNTHGVINSLYHTNSLCPRSSVSTQSAIVCSLTGPQRTFCQLPYMWLFKNFIYSLIYLFIHLLVYSFLHGSCNDAVTIASTAQRRMV
jgi:hypothetical protein